MWIRPSIVVGMVVASWACGTRVPFDNLREPAYQPTGCAFGVAWLVIYSSLVLAAAWPGMAWSTTALLGTALALTCAWSAAVRLNALVIAALSLACATALSVASLFTVPRDPRDAETWARGTGPAVFTGWLCLATALATSIATTDDVIPPVVAAVAVVAVAAFTAQPLVALPLAWAGVRASSTTWRPRFLASAALAGLVGTGVQLRVVAT